MRILVELDGILRGQRNDEPIMAGIQIVGALSAYNQIIFMTNMSKLEAEQWINVNKVVDFDLILDSSVGLEGENLKERQVQVARNRGQIDLMITSDPTLWVYAFDQGIPSIMFGIPSYLRAEFRPDAPKRIRSWDQIQESVEKQNELRTKDARLSRTEALNFE
jgi:hypothetical protein